MSQKKPAAKAKPPRRKSPKPKPVITITAVINLMAQMRTNPKWAPIADAITNLDDEGVIEMYAFFDFIAGYATNPAKAGRQSYLGADIALLLDAKRLMNGGMTQTAALKQVLPRALPDTEAVSEASKLKRLTERLRRYGRYLKPK